MNTKLCHLTIIQPTFLSKLLQVFKVYRKAGLVLLGSDFYISEWDRIVELGELIVNLLRTVRSNPNMSAYEYLFE